MPRILVLRLLQRNATVGILKGQDHGVVRTRGQQGLCIYRRRNIYAGQRDMHRHILLDCPQGRTVVRVEHHHIQIGTIKVATSPTLQIVTRIGAIDDTVIIGPESCKWKMAAEGHRPGLGTRLNRDRPVTTPLHYHHQKYRQVSSQGVTEKERTHFHREVEVEALSPGQYLHFHHSMRHPDHWTG